MNDGHAEACCGGKKGGARAARECRDGHCDKASGLAAFAETLPADRAAVVRKAIAEKEDTLETLRKAERASRSEARSALMAQPFDAARFREALAHAADAYAQSKRARLEVLADTAAILTQEERLELHSWFEARRRMRHRDDDEAKVEPPALKNEVAPASAQ